MYELVRFAERVVRRGKVRWIEAARAALIAERDRDGTAVPERRMVAEGGVGRIVRPNPQIAVESRGAAARARRDVDDRAEPFAILCRIRTFDDVGERDVVRIELRSDVPIEFLRNRDAVDDIVDVPVIAVDVNDAVGPPGRAGQLN